MIDVGIFVIIMGLAAIVIGCYIHLYYTHSLYASRCDSSISFNRFLEIYEHSSDHINLGEGYFTYFYYDEGSFHAATYNFYFSIPDTFRYERWCKKIKRKEEKARSKKLMNQMEELWAKDAQEKQNQNTH